MATPELVASWQRTTARLCEARSHFSVENQSLHANWLADVDEFIEHNELGLAYDYLESIARESEWNSEPLLAALAGAAREMGKNDRFNLLQRRLAALRMSV